MSAALDPTVSLALRVGVGALLGGAVWHKARDRAAFRAALAGYALVPARALPWLARGLPTAEAGLAAALLVPASAPAAALGAAALLAAYALAMAAALARGRRGIDCGCGGPAGARALGPHLVARNALFVAVALAAALPPAPRRLGWLDLVTLAGVLASLACLSSAAELSLAQARRGRALRRRSA